MYVRTCSKAVEFQFLTKFPLCRRTYHPLPPNPCTSLPSVTPSFLFFFLSYPYLTLPIVISFVFCTLTPRRSLRKSTTTLRDFRFGIFDIPSNANLRYLNADSSCTLLLGGDGKSWSRFYCFPRSERGIKIRNETPLLSYHRDRLCQRSRYWSNNNCKVGKLKIRKAYKVSARFSLTLRDCWEQNVKNSRECRRGNKNERNVKRKINSRRLIIFLPCGGCFFGLLLSFRRLISFLEDFSRKHCAPS